MPSDMRRAMKQAAEMQAEMERRQTELSEQLFEGTAGGGVVKVTVLGSGRLAAVDIDPRVLDRDDPEMVGDLVVAAANQAMAAMADAAAASLGSLSGLDLGGLLGS